MENKSEIDISQYPSVGLAYELVKSSYDVMVSRFDAANSRIQNILTWAVGVTAIAPLFVKKTDGKSNILSPWFLLVLFDFFVLALTGIWAHRMDGVKLISPEVIYNKYLTHSEWEFKRRLIYWSGQHFNTNQQLINKKCFFIDILTLLLGLEVFLIFIWLLKG